MKRINGIRISRGIRARSVAAIMFIVFLGWSAAGFAQGTVQDQTQADFSQGTTGANTAIVLEDNGEVILAPAFSEEFSGPALGAGWGSGIYSGSAPSLSDGQVFLNGSWIYSTATYGPGSVLELETTFTQNNHQFLGFAIAAEIGSTYFFIGRGGQGSGDYGLYMRNPSGDIPLGTGLLGAPHRFKIKWNTSGFEVYIDDATTPSGTVNYPVGSVMHLFASDYNPGASDMLSVDWMRVTPYAAAGSFTSRVFDGGADVIWGTATWDAALPASTDLSVLVRTGGTSVPDGTWTAFTEVPVSGSVINQTSRYIQYRADLSSENTLFTPALRSLGISYTLTGNTPPSITLQPVSMSTCMGGIASFTSNAIGIPEPWVVWESSPDGETWTPVAGASSSTLSFTATSGNNNMRYRAVWTNGINPPDVSSGALLTVHPQLAAEIEAVNNEICEGSPVQLRLRTAATNGQAPYTVVVNGVSYPASSTGSVFATFSTGELTIWPSSPGGAPATDNQPIEVGVRFRSSVPGYIKGIRFYNGDNNTGTYTGHLWNSSGDQLAEAEFTNVGTNGWQEVRFRSPVAILANTTYVASYYSSSGYFSVTSGGLMAAVSNGPLTALAHNIDGPNGTFGYGEGYPEQGIGSNYWVDIIFSEVGSDPVTLSYSLTSVIDANGCTLTGSPVINTVSVTVNPAPEGVITPVRNNLYEGEEYELLFTSTNEGPFGLEINGSNYTNIASGVPFKAGTVSYIPPPSTIWPPSAVGGSQKVDSTLNTLGLRFRSSIPGNISGIRFYKQRTTSLEFIVSLWEEGNTTALHTQSYTTDNTLGWKQVDFAAPISIDPNKTYIVSYYAVSQYPYAYTPNYSFPLTSRPLTALGCCYTPGLGYPATANPANYWADVVFTSTTGIATFNLTTITSGSGCVATDNPISTATIFITQAKVWTGGGADAGWNTVENWLTGVVPSSVENVVIPKGAPHYPAISGPLITGALIISPLASMTVNSGVTLTVNGELRTTEATMIINSSGTASSGSLIVNGTATGNVTYNRDMPEDRYRYVSSPVDSSRLPLGTVFWKWNEEIGYWGDTPSQDPVTACETGRGYTMDTDGSPVAFTGRVLTTSATVTATAPYDENDVRIPGRAWGGGGWNLLGNPYPSALRVVDEDVTPENDFIHQNLSSFEPEYQAIYIYDGTDYDYLALGTPGYTAGMGIFPGNDIQAGQGFFVLAHHDEVPFTFMPEMRTHNTTAVMTKSGTVPWPGVQLKVRSASMETSTLVVYGEGMSAGLDPGYDVGHLSSGADAEIYTVLAGGGSDYNFARQALPVSEAGSTVVPVGVDFPGGGEVTFSAFTIPLDGRKFWLEDRVAKTFTDLSRASYTVTLPANSYGTGRFFIIASANTPTGTEQTKADDGGLRIWNSGGTIVIQGEVSEGSLCEIYTISGGKILERKLTGGEMNTVEIPAGSAGLLIVRVTDGMKVVTKKVAIPG